MDLRDGAWEGKSVAIIGGGPSLRAFDWELLKVFDKVVGVNKAYTAPVKLDMLVAMDDPFWRRHGGAVLEACPKVPRVHVTLNRATEKSPYANRKVKTLEEQGPKADWWGTSILDGIRCGGCSGHATLNLVDLLVGERGWICLFGFDCSASEEGPWWHSGYAKDYAPPQASYDRWVESFTRSSRHVSADVSVLVPTRLKCFRRIMQCELEELLR